MEMSSRKKPTAMTPPMIWILDTMPKPLPHAATPINSRPTNLGGERVQDYLKEINFLVETMVATIYWRFYQSVNKLGPLR